MSTAPIAAGDVEKPVPSLRAMPAAQTLSKQPFGIIQSREVSLFLREDPGALAEGGSSGGAAHAFVRLFRSLTYNPGYALTVTPILRLVRLSPGWICMLR